MYSPQFHSQGFGGSIFIHASVEQRSLSVKVYIRFFPYGHPELRLLVRSNWTALVICVALGLLAHAVDFVWNSSDLCLFVSWNCSVTSVCFRRQKEAIVCLKALVAEVQNQRSSLNSASRTSLLICSQEKREDGAPNWIAWDVNKGIHNAIPRIAVYVQLDTRSRVLLLLTYPFVG